MAEPDPNGPYAIVAAEAQQRPVRYTQLEVIDGSESVIGFAGSLLVFVAPRGSSVLDDVRAAASGDEERAQQLRSRYSEQEDEPEPGSSEELAELMVGAPVFADIIYGGQVVNRGLFLPDGADLLVVGLAYTGGRLSAEGCTLAEHYLPDSDLQLEGVVVQVAPPLTDAERSLLEVAPLDRRVAALNCEHTTWWVAAGAGAVVGVGLTTVGIVAALAAMVADDQLDHLSEDEIVGLDPSASIDELLEIRRRLLLRRFDDETY